jgi:hypothetical protein
MKKIFRSIKQKLCKHRYEVNNQFTIYDPDNEKVTHVEYVCSKCNKKYIKVC